MFFGESYEPPAWEHARKKGTLNKKLSESFAQLS
jgi:hypothetical protein